MRVANLLLFDEIINTARKLVHKNLRLLWLQMKILFSGFDVRGEIPSACECENGSRIRSVNADRLHVSFELQIWVGHRSSLLHKTIELSRTLKLIGSCRLFECVLHLRYQSRFN